MTDSRPVLGCALPASAHANGIDGRALLWQGLEQMLCLYALRCTEETSPLHPMRMGCLVLLLRCDHQPTLGQPARSLGRGLRAIRETTRQACCDLVLTVVKRRSGVRAHPVEAIQSLVLLRQQAKFARCGKSASSNVVGDSSMFVVSFLGGDPVMCVFLCSCACLGIIVVPWVAYYWCHH